MKKLPVEVDVPEYLVKLGLLPEATELDKARGDLSLVAFYYLLRVGEYTCKGRRNKSKQTVQYRMEDVRFFRTDSDGRLKQLSKWAPDEMIMSTDCTTLKVDNQKMVGETCASTNTTMGMRFFRRSEDLDGDTATSAGT
jgi:hypothetical protein